MKNSRRMKRMARNRKKVSGLNLTSLMDVFTILVFFLLSNSGSAEVLTPPKQIKLPASVVETKPRETMVIIVTPDDVLVQGDAVVKTETLLEGDKIVIPEIRARLDQLGKNMIGISAEAIADSQEITVLADKTIPFKILKKVMSTCTLSGYGKISLAVNQKASQN